MQPFTPPPPTTPTFVRLPSPKEVFPQRSPSRRFPFKSKGICDVIIHSSATLVANLPWLP